MTFRRTIQGRQDYTILVANPCYESLIVVAAKYFFRGSKMPSDVEWTREELRCKRNEAMKKLRFIEAARDLAIGRLKLRSFGLWLQVYKPLQEVLSVADIYRFREV